jgi:hypothetical protein
MRISAIGPPPSGGRERAHLAASQPRRGLAFQVRLQRPGSSRKEGGWLPSGLMRCTSLTSTPSYLRLRTVRMT